jgi:hypothetical protein
MIEEDEEGEREGRKIKREDDGERGKEGRKI